MTLKLEALVLKVNDCDWKWTTHFGSPYKLVFDWLSIVSIRFIYSVYKNEAAR